MRPKGPSAKCALRRAPLLLSFLHLRFNGLLETRKASLKEQPPVYENCGCSLNVCLSGAANIPVDERRYGRILEIMVKLFHLQAELLGDCLYLGIAEIVLVREQLVVHFPELSLFPGGEGCYGRLPGIIVHRKGILFDYKFDVFREFLQHLLEEGIKPRAVGSLVIVINSDGDRSVFGPLKWEATHVDLINAFERYDLKHFFRATRN